MIGLRRPVIIGGGRLAAERTSGWARQLRVTPLPTWSYVVVKTATGMLVMLPVVALVEVVSAGFGSAHCRRAPGWSWR